MKYFFIIPFVFITFGFFLNFGNIVQAQSCNSLKEIFENSDYCDGKWISLQGKVYEVLDAQTLQGSKYIYGFQFTDDETNIIRVVSQDKLFLIKNDEVVINGGYHKKLYADGLNLDDTIVASGKNINVILTGEEYTDLLVNYVGKGMLQTEDLQKRSIILIALIPLFSFVAFVIGYHWYRHRKHKGTSFEGYIEDLFRKNKEWKVERDNSYRNLRKGWVESYNDPDFVFVHRRTSKKIAVECKHKPKEYDRIFWAYEDQIEHYQNFSQKQNIPVFVVLGIGGRPKNPKRMFFVLLDKIQYPDVKMKYLEKFERDPKKYFSLDDV